MSETSARSRKGGRRRFLAGMLCVVWSVALAAAPSPAAAVDFDAYPVSAGARPHWLAVGADGNVWFTESDGNKIGRLQPDGTVTEFGGLAAGSRPGGITGGPVGDNHLWFTEVNANKIGEMNTSGAVVNEFPIPTANSSANFITTGSDGNLWFTECNANKIGRMTPAGTFTEFSAGIAPGGCPAGITAGSDGNLWFTEFTGNRIGRITTAGVVTEFPLAATGAQPRGITTGPDGNLWFGEANGNKIGRMTTAGLLTGEFPIPTANSNPGGITAAEDGNLWFTEIFGNKIARITPGGQIVEFDMPDPSTAPDGIVDPFPDGVVAAGNDADKLYRLQFAKAVAVAPPDIDFGGVPVGTLSPSRTFTVTNTGTLDVLVQNVNIDSDQFGIDGDQCSGQVLVPKQVCEVSTEFLPDAVATFFAAAVVTHDASTSPDEVALHGTGFVPTPPPISVIGRPELHIEKQLLTDGPINEGDLVKFLIQVVNEGTGTAENVTVYDLVLRGQDATSIELRKRVDLPEDCDFNADYPVPDSRMACHLGDIGPGAPPKRLVVVMRAHDMHGRFLNSASLGVGDAKFSLVEFEVRNKDVALELVDAAAAVGPRGSGKIAAECNGKPPCDVGINVIRVPFGDKRRNTIGSRAAADKRDESLGTVSGQIRHKGRLHIELNSAGKKLLRQAETMTVRLRGHATDGRGKRGKVDTELILHLDSS